MNVDEAMADVENNIKNNPSKYSSHYKEVAETLVAEVKRLRAEVQRLDIAGIHSCHDDCQKLPCVQRREIERLRAECDFHSEACKGLIAELAEKKAENDKLRAELAAAKAASVVTDEEVQAAFDNWYDSDDEGEPFNDIGKFFMGDGWKAGVDWLRERQKERGEG